MNDHNEIGASSSMNIAEPTISAHQMNFDDDEEDECRICRGPVEVGCPLIRPCKCAGSIGLTHQHCLKEWLNVTKKDHCELCKTVFNFTPLYAEGTPERLQFYDVVLGVLHRAAEKWLPFALRVIIAILLWVCILPLTTAYLYYGWIHRPSSVVSRWEPDLLAIDTVSGAVVVGVIIITFLSLMSFADFLRFRWQNGEQNDANAANLDAAVAAAAVAAEAAILDGEDDDDDDEEDFFHGDEDFFHGDEGDHEFERDFNNDFEHDDIGVRDNARDEIDAHGEINVQHPRENLRPIPRPANRPDNNNRFEPRFEPMDPVMDQDDGMDIHVALDELLGLRGPLTGLVRNLLWLLAFNTTYLGLFACLPYTIGQTVFSFLSKSDTVQQFFDILPVLSYSGVTLSHIVTSLNIESRKRNALLQLPDLATMALGYLSLAAIVFVGHAMASSYKRLTAKEKNDKRNQRPNAPNHGENLRQNGAFNFPNANVDEDNHVLAEEAHVDVVERTTIVIDCINAIVKVTVLLFFKMLILPLILGLWLDVTTLSLFNSSVHDRVIYAGNDLFGSLFVHWVSGITFMLLVTVSVLQLREVVHPELLAKVIRPQEPQPDLLGNLLNESGPTHVTRLVLSLVMYFVLLSIHIWLPAQIFVATGISDYLPYFRPKFWYILLPQLQIPMELVVFHLGMLAFLEKYKNNIGEMQHLYLNWMCNKMGLSDSVLPKTVSHFMLVGVRPLYLAVKENTTSNADSTLLSGDELKFDKHAIVESRQIEFDPFWKDLGSNETPTHDIITSGVSEFRVPPILERGITKRSGQRILTTQSHIRIQSEKHPDGKLSIPTSIGPYRLRAHMKNNRRNFTSLEVDTSASIEVWEEVLGDIIHRPPEGWDDLGVGGAEVQGRWAWGDEKKSDTEEGVGSRIPFTCHKNKALLLLKLSTLLLILWLGTLVIMCGVLNIPTLFGRCFFRLLYVSENYIHDPAAFAVGAVLLVPLINVVISFFSDVDGNNGAIKIFLWASSFQRPPSAGKMHTLAMTLFFWSFFTPMTIGILFLLCVVADEQWWSAMIFSLNLDGFLKPWVVGVILFHLWAALCYFGILKIDFWTTLIGRGNAAQDVNGDIAVINNIRDPIQGAMPDMLGDSPIIQWQGTNGRLGHFAKAIIPVIANWEWDKVDHKVFLLDLFYPIMYRLLITLSVPCVVVISVNFFMHTIPEIDMEVTGIIVPRTDIFHDGLFYMTIFRVSLLAVIVVQLVLSFKGPLNRWFQIVHKAARDDRYLIGETLMNYQ